jgi:anti-sigma regulatory factor (Ser/Thr protein kinase)
MQQQTSKASRAVTADTPARAALSPPAVRPHRDRRDSPSRHASADLAAEPAAAGRARSLIRDTLARWHLDHLADDAEAIASELITNAVDKAQPPRAALPAIIFAIHRRPGELRIIVWDNGPGHPARTDAGPDAEAGRGLAIVDALSGQKWGWWPTPRSGGKVVWAALPAPAIAPAPDDPAPQLGAS